MRAARSIVIGIVIGIVMLIASPAVAQKELGYAVGAGMMLPLGADVADAADPGLGIDLGLFYKLMPNLAAGLHLNYASGFGKDNAVVAATTAGNTHTFVAGKADFIGVAAAVIYEVPIGIMGDFWAQFDLGFYLGKLSYCPDDGRTCGVYDEQHLGLAVSVGATFDVYSALSLGPAVSITFPNYREFASWMFLTASLRGHWGM